MSSDQAAGTYGLAVTEGPDAPSIPAQVRAAWRPGGWTDTAVALAVALSARLAYLATVSSQPLLSDSGQYHEIATNLADGRGFVHTFPQFELHATAFRPPVFPALLALVYRVTGSSQGVARGLAVALGCVLVVVLHRVLRHHVGRRTALVGALAVALYPPLVANDVVPLTETLSLIVIVLLADRIARDAWVWAGVLCGLLILTRPSAQGLVVVVGISLWIFVGPKRAAAAIGIAALVVVPWVVRNAVEVGAPTVVTSNGFNFAALYSAEAEAAGRFVDPVYYPGFDDMRLLQFDEAAWNDELQRRALANIRRNPWQVLDVVGANATAFFELDPDKNTNPEKIDGRNMDVRDASLPLFYVVTVVGSVGLWLGRRNRFVAVLALTALYFTATSLFFVAPPRLRAPLDLACCVGLAIVVDRVWAAVERRRSGLADGRTDGVLDGTPAVGTPR